MTETHKKGLDWNEDKKLFLTVWNALKTPRFAKTFFSLASVFLFSVSTDDTLGIFETFKDGGIVTFLLLMVPPYLISSWAVPVDFNSVKTRKAVFLTVACVLLTALALSHEQSSFLARAFIANIGILLFWAWAVLFKSVSERAAP